MKYAIIKASGAQYRVSEGDELDLFHVAGKEAGDAIEFPEVLLVRDGDQLAVGQPTLTDASVHGSVVSQHRGDKIRVATYKAKSRHRRTIGHRDSLTRVKIERIVTQKPEKKAVAKGKMKE